MQGWRLDQSEEIRHSIVNSSLKKLRSNADIERNAHGRGKGSRAVDLWGVAGGLSRVEVPLPSNVSSTSHSDLYVKHRYIHEKVAPESESFKNLALQTHCKALVAEI